MFRIIKLEKNCLLKDNTNNRGYKIKIFKLEVSSNVSKIDMIRRENIRIRMTKKGFVDPNLIL